MRLLLVGCCLLGAVRGVADEHPRFPAKLIREFDNTGDSPISGLAFIPNSSKIATINSAGILITWDLPTGQQRASRSALGYQSPLVATPSGKSLVTFDQPGNLVILDVDTLEPQNTIGFADKNHSRKLALSPDGSRALIGSNAAKIQLVELETGKLIASRDRVSEFTQFVGFSADGKHCLFCGQSRQGEAPATLGMRWDPEKDEVVFRWQFPVFGTAFGMWDLPDGRWVGVGGNPTKLVVWDPKTRQELMSLDPQGHINARSQDRNRVVIAGRNGNSATVFDLSRDKPLLGKFATETDPTVIELNATGTDLLIATQQGALQHWRLRYPGDETEIASALHPENETLPDVRIAGPDFFGDIRLTGHRSNILQVVPLADSRHVVTTGFDNRVVLWDLDANKIVRRVDGLQGKAFDLYFGAAASRDGKQLLLSGGQSKGQQNLSLWDVGALEQKRKYDGLTDVAWAVAFSPDGSRIAAASGKEVIVWDTETGKEVAKFDPGPGNNGLRVFSLDFDRTGKFLFYSHRDTLFRQAVEDKDDRRESKLGQIQALRRRPSADDDDDIVVETGSAVLFLNPRNLNEIRRLKLPGHASSLSLSEDGRRVAAICGSDALVWEHDREEPTYRAKSSNQRMTKGCLTPDGLRLILVEGNRLRISKLSAR